VPNIRKVSAGAPFKPSASAWNAFADKANERPQGGGGGGGGGSRLLVKNNSGTDVARFGILGVGGAQIAQTDNANEFYNKILLDGESPVLATHCGKFVVCLEPVSDGQVGLCTMNGLIQVQVDMIDADDNWCDIYVAGFAKLKSYGAGSAEIIHKPAGTGDKWCLVQLGKSHGPATRYRGLINDAGGFTSAQTTAMDGLEAVDGVPVETALATVQNPFGWDGDDNVEALAEWNASQEQWELRMIAC
jgi:hypothetical protein